MEKEAAVRGPFTSASTTGFPYGEAEDGAVAKSAIDRFLSVALYGLRGEPSFAFVLLHAFVTHCVLLPRLSVESRARSSRSVHPDLEIYLRDIFLPTVYLALEITPHADEIDVDGRVFLELLHFIRLNATTHPRDVFGAEVYVEVETLWAASKQPPVDYPNLVVSFPISKEERQSPVSPTVTSHSHLAVLPFSNPVFDKALSSMRLHVDVNEQIEPAIHMEFQAPFVDNHHWHNHRRAILPKHLGGVDERSAQQTQWERARKLRSEQRFMAKMQWQAESLTGASGAALHRITIVAGQSEGAKSKTVTPGNEVSVRDLKYGIYIWILILLSSEIWSEEQREEGASLQSGAYPTTEHSTEESCTGLLQ